MGYCYLIDASLNDLNNFDVDNWFWSVFVFVVYNALRSVDRHPHPTNHVCR